MLYKRSCKKRLIFEAWKTWICSPGLPLTSWVILVKLCNLSEFQLPWWQKQRIPFKVVDKISNMYIEMFSYSCVPGTQLMLVPSAFLVKSIPDRREITNNQTSCKLPSSTSFIKTLQELLNNSKTDSFPFTFLNYSIG